MTKEELRLHVLRAWAADTRARSFLTPDDSWLTTIARDGVTPGPGVCAEVDLWRPTLDWLLHQLKFGMLTPHTQLPSALAVPVSSATLAPEVANSSPKGAQGAVAATRAPRSAPIPAMGVGELSDTHVDRSRDDSPALAALKEWRRMSLALGVPGIFSLKESHLRQVASSHWRTPEEIRAAFKPVVGEFADELARVLTTYVPAGEPVDASMVDAVPAVPYAAPHAETSSPSPGSPGSPGAAGSHAAPPVTDSPSAPDPSLTPGPSPSVPVAPDEVDPGGFAAYEFGPSGRTPGVLQFAAQRGGLGVRWEAADPQAVYRLVSSDEHPPFSPDHADVVATTIAGTARDPRPYTHAVRHFQVWCNEGSSVEDAKFSQPELHAAGALIAPVLDLDIREDEGRVIGQWRVLDGTQRVQVFRIPMSVSGSASDPRYRILSEATNLGGFVDSQAVRGEKYRYQIYSEALVDGIAQLSAPLTIPIAVSIVHEPILDLSFTLHDDVDSPFFDLSWTAPAGGRAVIYRTTQAPKAGIERRQQDESVLEQAGLTLDRRLAHPITQDGDRPSMMQVPWPGNWARAYFTIVVIQDGVAFVGNTVRGVRVPPVTRAKFTQRVSAQFLTFAWPDGADVVQVYRGQTGGDPAHALAGPAHEVSATEYREKGGLYFGGNTLNALGGELHLVSVAFDGGQRVRGKSVTLVYPSLLMLSYRLVTKRTISGKVSVSITIASSVTLENPPPFVLVHNPDRLPLSATDGVAVAMVRDVEGESAVVRQFVPPRLGPNVGDEPGWRSDPTQWQRDVPLQRGFLRLFVSLPAPVLQGVALIDPPLSTLRLQSLRERTRGIFSG